MPRPKPRRSSSTESCVGQRLRSPRACHRRAAGSPGSRGAAGAGRRSPSPSAGPGNRTGTCLATAHRLGFVLDQRCRPRRWATCTLIGPTSSGGRRPARRPRSSPARPCRWWSSSVAMITSQQPSSAALPAKQRPELMPTSGTRPDSLREAVEGVGVEAGTDCVGVARPPAAAFGEEHHRQPPVLGQLEHAVLSSGGCACPACRPAPCSRRRHRGTRAASSGRTGRR